MKTQIAIALMLASTTVLADSHSEKKAGSAAAKPADAKKPADAPKPAAMAAPTPPPELAAAAKQQAGNWKCTGKGAMDPAKPTEMTEFKGTYKAALDGTLDKFWIKGEWNATAGKIKMKGFIYQTYDPMGKKWHRIMIDNWGMSGTDSSVGLPAGATEGKVVWEGDSRMGSNMIKSRTTEEIAAKSMKMTAEASMDGGKKFMTGMEMTCTK
jgi:hypothetical protein